MTFPETVLRVPGLHRRQDGGTFNYLGVNDQSELDAALADGWSLTMAEAIASVEAKAMVAEVAEAQEAIDDISPATRDELERKAKDIGVGFNSRTSDAVLAQRIAEAL